MHTVKETDMLAGKIDLLLSRLNERAHKNEAIKATIQGTDSQMTCEVCGVVRITAPKTVKMQPTSTNATIMGGTISPAHKEVIRTSIQISI